MQKDVLEAPVSRWLKAMDKAVKKAAKSKKRPD